MQDTEQNTTPTKNKNAIYTYQPNDNFCSELKKLRERKHLSQSDFAKDLHISITSVQNWENGRRFPNDFACAEIISLFSLTDEEASLLFIIKKKDDDFPAVSEAENEEAIASEVAQKKPLTTIFKESWFKIRKPFVIGVAVWIVEWILIVAVSAIGYHYSTSGAEYSNYQREILIFDGAELALLLGLSFIATVVIFTLIYFFKRRKQTQ